MKCYKIKNHWGLISSGCFSLTGISAYNRGFCDTHFRANMLFFPAGK